MRIRLSLNPVLVKEMRGRMRGPRAYLFLTGTLALLGVVTYGLYRLVRFTITTPGGIPSSAVIGQSLFTGLVLLATMVICAIAPSLTASAVSGEHERKTFDLLMATPLDSSSVLLGKLIAALSYVALLLLATLPMVSLAFVFGGVSLVDLIQSFLLLLVFALTFGMIGLFFSALFRRTGLAVGASYVVLAFLVFGTMFAYAVIGVVRGNLPPRWVLVLNPFSAMSSAVVPAPTPGMFSFSGIISVLTGLVGGMGFDPRVTETQPLWQITLGAYLWLTVVLYLVTAQLVKPVRRFQPRARTLAIGGLVLAISIVAPLVIYGPLTPERLVAWVQWMRSTPKDLVENGQFVGSLAKWQSSAYVDRGDEAEGTVKLVSENDRQVLRIQRTGSSQSTTSITQAINQSLSSAGWLQMRAEVRIKDAAPVLCGSQGNTCPLTIKLVFAGSDGTLHEWSQGFHIVEGQFASVPPFCVSCESRENHVPVKLGEWYTFESRNLLATPFFRNASTIRSVTLAAAGQSYEIQVAQVALVAREGRPIDFTGRDSGTPTPGAFRGMVAPGGIVVPAVPVAPPPRALPPEPMPTPTPIPTTTRMPGPTPSPVTR